MTVTDTCDVTMTQDLCVCVFEGVEDTDVMPEKTTPDDPEETPASPPPKKKVATPEDVAAPHVALTDSDTDRTMTDGEM